jgi:hypothetical protein
MTNQKTMMLVNADYSDSIKTFKMIPISNESPYVECIFAAPHKQLVIINKYTKQQFKFLPRIDDNGDVMMMKSAKRHSGQNYKEERIRIEINYEHHLITEKEQNSFIEMFAINADTFNYKEHTSGEVMKKAEEELDRKNKEAEEKLKAAAEAKSKGNLKVDTTEEKTQEINDAGPGNE